MRQHETGASHSTGEPGINAPCHVVSNRREHQRRSFLRHRREPRGDSRGNGPPGRRLPPCSGGNLPVRMLECAGSVSGATDTAWSNCTPSRARASSAGVSTSRAPYAPIRSARVVSRVMRTTFRLRRAPSPVSRPSSTPVPLRTDRVERTRQPASPAAATSRAATAVHAAHFQLNLRGAGAGDEGSGDAGALGGCLRRGMGRQFRAHPWNARHLSHAGASQLVRQQVQNAPGSDTGLSVSPRASRGPPEPPSGRGRGRAPGDTREPQSPGLLWLARPSRARSGYARARSPWPAAR